MANLITFIRLLLVPIFLYFVFSYPHKLFYSGIILILAAFTDFLDGYVARNWGRVTKLGIFLDPLVDRLLILTAITSLSLKGLVEWWAFFLLLTREIFVGAGYIFLKLRSMELPVNFLGKFATAWVVISLIGILMKVPFSSAIFYAGVVLYLASALNYGQIALKKIRVLK